MSIKKLSVALIVFILFFHVNVYANLRVDGDKFILDTTDGYYEKNRYYLPVEGDVTENYYVGLYKIGYIIPNKGKSGGDLFVEFGEKVILNRDIYYNLIDIEYIPKCIMFNEIIVYTDYYVDYYKIPFIYKDKMVIFNVNMTNENEKAEILGIVDDKGDKIDIPKGAEITPIYKYRDNGGESYLPRSEFINHQTLKLDNIVFDDDLIISMTTYNKDNYAIKIEILTWDKHLVVSEPIMLMDEVKFEKKINELFSKHTPSNWAISQVTKAIKYDLVTVKAMKDYQKYITREEFCELAVRLYEKLSMKTAEPIKNNPFCDTDNPEVLKAYNLNIVGGMGNGIFAPNDFISREQLAVMIYNTIKVSSLNGSEELKGNLSYKDKDNISNWATEAMGYMCSKSFIIGNDGMVFPKDNTTIEQAIMVILRVFEYYN